MATITPVKPGVVGQVVTPVTPAATDVIPAAAYRFIVLVAVSSTGTPTITVDDPTSQAPAGTGVQFNPDAQLSLTAGQSKVMRIDCARFRDTNGNINISTTSPTNSTIYVVGID